MPNPLPAAGLRTYGQCFLDVARLSGNVLAQGLATAGTATTLTDATNERTPTANANVVTGTFLSIYGGVAAFGSGANATDIALNTPKEITTYTLGIYTWQAAMAGAGPTTTSLWVRTRIPPKAILDAIDQVTRENAYYQARNYLSDSLATNDLLQGKGRFEEWSAGTTSNPDGWTGAGGATLVSQDTALVARENSVAVVSGIFALVLTGNAGVATLTYQVPNAIVRLVNQYGLQSLMVKGVMAETTAGDGKLVVAAQDSTGAYTNIATYTGTYSGNAIQELDSITPVTLAPPAVITAIQITLSAKSGTGVYFKDLMVYGPPVYEYDLPASVIALDPIIYEETGYRSGDYSIPLRADNGAWRANLKDPTFTRQPTIQFMGPFMEGGRRLRLSAWQAAATVSSALSNVNVNPEWLTLAAAIRVCESNLASKTAEQRLALLDKRMELLKRDNPRAIYSMHGQAVVKLFGF